MKSALTLTGVLSIFFIVLSSFNSFKSSPVGVILSGGGDWLVDPNGGGESDLPCLNPPEFLDLEFGFDAGGWNIQTLTQIRIEITICGSEDVIDVTVGNQGNQANSHNNPDDVVWYRHQQNLYQPQNAAFQGREVTGKARVNFTDGFPDLCDGNEGLVPANLCVNFIGKSNTGYEPWGFNRSETNLNICCVLDQNYPHDFDFAHGRHLDLNTDPFISQLVFEQGFQEGDNIEIYNSMGNVVFSKKVFKDAKLIRLGTEHLPSGIYFLKLFRKDKFFETQTVYKK